MSISFNNVRSCGFALSGGQQVGMYYVLASGPTYTTRNLTVATDLFTDTAIAGDYILFKINYGSAKFAGFSFTVGTAIVAAAVTVVWEYRLNDGTWAAFTGVVDNTNNFTTVGTNSVTWNMPTDWGTNATAVNGLTGTLWCRARLSVATTLTEGGRLSASTSFYDYAVKVDAGHEYDSGTATSGSTTVLNDTGKAWTVNALINRIVYIHTGTNAGIYRVVNSNTATSMTFVEPWSSTAIDNTSQYTILANFEDLYQADVAAGWGVIEKAGAHSYAFNSWLVFDAASFGDVGVSVEFPDNFYFYCKEAATNRYPLIFGFRLPLKYGLDKAVMGNHLTSIRTCCMDNRTLGYNVTSEYIFSAGNTYTLRHDLPSTGSDSYIRSWFGNYLKYSVSDTFEGWRSVTFPKTSPKTEVRRVTVQNGYSGIEQAFASFDGVRSIYNVNLGIYLTSATNITIPGAEVTFNNPVTAVYGNPIQWYNATGTHYIIDYAGVRFRPAADSYSSTPNTFSTFIQNTIRMRVSDERDNLLSNAKIQISDSLAQNRETMLLFDGAVGNNDTLIAPSDTNNSMNGTTAFSVEAWVFCTSNTAGSSVGRIVEKGRSAGVGYAIWNNGGSFYASIYTSTGVKNSNSVTVIQHTWKHIVMSWNGSNLVLYVDGSGTTPVAATGTGTDDTAQSLYIGNSDLLNRAFGGFIKRIRLYKNKGLSQADVNTLWDGGVFTQNEPCPISGCTAEYNFTEGTGSTLTDTVGGNIATLGAATAAPQWVDTNTGLTSNSLTAYTGTSGGYLNNQSVVTGTSYSLTSQPSTATQLRVVVDGYKDFSSNVAQSYIQFTGTDANGFAIQDTILIERIGTGVYFTKKEFATIDTNGIYLWGFNAYITIDSLGLLPVQTVNVENWKTKDDTSLVIANYNPIIIKVSRPGFEPVTIKKNIYEKQDLQIALKRSELKIE